MRNKRQREQKRRQYWQAIPDILKYQVVTKLLLSLILFGLGRLAMWAITSTGRVAVTSGDYRFLFTSWQGWLLIGIALAVLFLYTSFDINAKIYYSENLIRQEKDSVWHSVGKGILGLRSFLNPKGVLVILYIALLTPLVGVGVSISLTEGFYIPSFITSVIYSTPLYFVAYTVGMIAFAVLGVVHIFVLHEVLLGKRTAKEAGKASRELMRKNWKSFLLQSVVFLARMALLTLAVLLLTLVLPLALLYVLPLSGAIRRFWLIFVCLFGVMMTTLTALLATPFYIIRLTQMYESFTAGERKKLPLRDRRRHPFLMTGAVLLVAFLVLVSLGLNASFDEVFPQKVTVGVIAHRAGGNEDIENTVSGINTAASLGAYGSEIDIQRTADGYYVVNHDNTFARVTGDPRTPGEMTLEEVRQLTIQDTTGTGKPGAWVATFEEMLDAAKGKLILFTELKGSSADQQMADDAVRLIKERDMLEECVLISLKYDLINYIETTYPEVQTGYLTFAAYGNTAALNCDYLGLEEEAATSSSIGAIHDQGKKALVWTVNDKESQHHFLTGEADAIITDNVAQARELTEELNTREDLDRIVDRLQNWL